MVMSLRMSMQSCLWRCMEQRGEGQGLLQGHPPMWEGAGVLVEFVLAMKAVAPWLCRIKGLKRTWASKRTQMSSSNA